MYVEQMIMNVVVIINLLRLKEGRKGAIWIVNVYNRAENEQFVKVQIIEKSFQSNT